MMNKTETLLLALGFVSLQFLEAQTTDVTSIVKEALQNNAVTLEINNGSMRGDPAPKLPKLLKVEYAIDNVPSSVIIGERSTLTLKAPEGKKLEITKATYGQLAEKLVNVTDKVAAKVLDNKLSLLIDNGSMGGDPSRGDEKELRVAYTVGGALHQITVPERQTLNLPATADGQGVLVIVSAIYGAFAPAQK